MYGERLGDGVEIVKVYMGSDTSHIHGTHFTYTSEFAGV